LEFFFVGDGASSYVGVVVCKLEFFFVGDGASSYVGVICSS
jgi:hypothetical protein